MRTLLFIIVSASCAAIKTASSDDTSEKPIQKVIRLMKEMQTQLDKEAKEDEDMYEKMGCWCDTNEKEKTQAVAINTQRSTDLTASMEESTAIRAKEANEFQEFEKDNIVNTEQLKGAIMTLGKVHGAALDQQSLMQVKQLLKKQRDNHRRMFKGKKLSMSLLQDPVEAEVDSMLQ